MLNMLKQQANMAFTENGALTYASTMSDCLDLFATVGAIRSADESEIERRFMRAFAENPDIAMRILFYGRDIRGGLGERRVFRTILRWLAFNEPASLRKNIARVPTFGRWDDVLVLLDTPCAVDALRLIDKQLHADMQSEGHVSLLGKWLPSVNTSNREAVFMAKRIARFMGMTDAEYRRTVVGLRRKIGIIENNLREQDYTFDYEHLPSRALFKYRKAFERNDEYRYDDYLMEVRYGNARMNTSGVMPYEIIRTCLSGCTNSERASLDAAWNALEDFTNDEDAIVVMDGSGSMYWSGDPRPIDVAMSLAIYFAERSKGGFRNHFITFSENPRLVEIKGRDIVEKARYCRDFDEVANTNLQAVFELILRTAVENELTQAQLPSRLYIISDMEFDSCARGASVTNFERARRRFAENGYALPEVIFWNVASRNTQQPVRENDRGVALVSGCTPRLFAQVTGQVTTPYELMMSVIGSDRYAEICA